ncbi:MAG: hypothetical protein ACRYFS_20515 [Janthinobacterium lividum]
MMHFSGGLIHIILVIAVAFLFQFLTGCRSI